MNKALKDGVYVQGHLVLKNVKGIQHAAQWLYGLKIVKRN